MKYFILLLSLISLSAIADDSHWQIAIGLGGSVNQDKTLTIQQDNQPNLTFDATFESKPFTKPFYYGLKVSHLQNNSAWEFEHLHQKLYVDDLPTNIQHFEITDGYNLFYVNRSWLLPDDNLRIRVGAGAVVAHPQITVNGVETYKKGGGAIPTIWNNDSGYQWAGISAQVGLEKSFTINDNLSISAEAKITHSQATIDLENGSVKVPNTALHGLVWLNYQF